MFSLPEDLITLSGTEIMLFAQESLDRVGV